jgi:hypothetical protein
MPKLQACEFSTGWPLPLARKQIFASVAKPFTFIHLIQPLIAIVNARPRLEFDVRVVRQWRANRESTLRKRTQPLEYLGFGRPSKQESRCGLPTRVGLSPLPEDHSTFPDESH